jgi:hypothetical protein
MGLRLIFRAWRNTNAIFLALVGITSFAIYYGNLMDRVTSQLFINTSSLFQHFDKLGWAISSLLACVVIIGPFDYWIQQSSGTNLDLVITMLLIYFFTSIIIGRTMSGQSDVSGFLLGFLTIVYINYLTYTILYATTMAVENAELLTAFIQGFYGITDMNLFFVKSTLINGTILGVFGFFWTVVFNAFSNNNRLRAENFTKKCAPMSNYCLVVKKKSALNKSPLFNDV